MLTQKILENYFILNYNIPPLLIFRLHLILPVNEYQSLDLSCCNFAFGNVSAIYNTRCYIALTLLNVKLRMDVI